MHTYGAFSLFKNKMWKIFQHLSNVDSKCDDRHGKVRDRFEAYKNTE